MYASYYQMTIMYASYYQMTIMYASYYQMTTMYASYYQMTINTEGVKRSPVFLPRCNSSEVKPILRSDENK